MSSQYIPTLASASQTRPDGNKSHERFIIRTGVLPMRKAKSEAFCAENWNALGRAHRQFAGVAGNCQSGSYTFCGSI